MKVYAVIPVKSLEKGKRRLSPILSESQRRRLTLCMLKDVLSVVLKFRGLEGAVVVSSDVEILSLAERLGAVSLAEKGDEGVNRAVSKGIEYCLNRGASAGLILPADIPLLSRMDLETIEALGLKTPSVTIAPSLRFDGTNALLLNPPDAIQTSYDADSFQSHFKAGGTRGLKVKVYLSARVMLDLDLPEDLNLFLKLREAKDTETYKFASETLKLGVQA